MSIFDQLERHRNWDEDDKLVLAQVDRLCADVIAPNAEHADATGEFPWANVRAINELGLNGVFIPEEFGGSPTSFRLYLAIVKRISEACASTGIIYATNFHAMKPLIEFGTPEQKSRLLPCIAEGCLASLAITEESA
ncbi:MAG: acyl-CoA dehydrogenase family protein, partial [Beijerinckiaceae bacterium]|nr:acyl-CoA dehydrogenase family protein [Beijerinckiaceae bacterium]